MIDIQIRQMPNFKKIYKKMPEDHKVIVNNVIRSIVSNPAMGEEKKGDLSGVFVYKFKIYQQQMLLAYKWDFTTRVLLALGVHENFYRDLKRK